MKLASHLWRSRHGIYYFRFSHGSLDIKRSLKTRDPLIAKSFAYKLGNNMTNPDEILAKLNLNQTKTKGWILKTPDLEIQTDGSAVEHSQAVEVIKLVYANKDSKKVAHQLHDTTVKSVQKWTLAQCVQDYRLERDQSVRPRTWQAWVQCTTHIAC